MKFLSYKVIISYNSYVLPCFENFDRSIALHGSFVGYLLALFNELKIFYSDTYQRHHKLPTIWTI